MTESDVARPEKNRLAVLRLMPTARARLFIAPSEASPRVRAWFAAKAADLHATLGQHDACLRALEQTEVVLRAARASGSVERPAHVPCGFDETWLLAERGACLSRLGQSEATRGALDAAMDRYGGGFGRGRLWLLLARARTFVHDEEPEEACRQATEVATQAHDVGFALVLHEVRRLHRSDLAPWATTPAVRDLGEQLAS